MFKFGLLAIGASAAYYWWTHHQTRSGGDPQVDDFAALDADKPDEVLDR